MGHIYGRRLLLVGLLDAFAALMTGGWITTAIGIGHASVSRESAPTTTFEERLASGVDASSKDGREEAFRILGIDQPPATASPNAQQTAPDDPAKEAGSKISRGLMYLVEEHKLSIQREPAGKSLFFENSLLAVGDGMVVVDAIASGDPRQLQAKLAKLGGVQQSSVAGGVVSGRLPISAINGLSRLKSLRFARPAYVMTSAGTVTSQGDSAMRTDDVRSAFGLDGSGVTVGTLSDSFDCRSGASADVASGDLPGGIVVLAEEPGCSSGSDEGRAMMQLIHDAAPGASQMFHTAFAGQADFAQGIIGLRNSGADVIVDDVFYFAEPMFQDGIIAQAVDTVVAGGASYFSAAANDGPNDVAGVTVTGSLPGGVSFGTATSSQGSCAQFSGTVTCSLGNMDNGASATVTITVTVNQGIVGEISNIANVGTVGVNHNDPNAANNSAIAPTTGPAAPTITTTPPPAPTPPPVVAGSGGSTTPLQPPTILRGEVSPQVETRLETSDGAVAVTVPAEALPASVQGQQVVIEVSTVDPASVPNPPADTPIFRAIKLKTFVGDDVTEVAFDQEVEVSFPLKQAGLDRVDGETSRLAVLRFNLDTSRWDSINATYVPEPAPGSIVVMLRSFSLYAVGAQKKVITPSPTFTPGPTITQEPTLTLGPTPIPIPTPPLATAIPTRTPTPAHTVTPASTLTPQQPTPVPTPIPPPAVAPPVAAAPSTSTAAPEPSPVPTATPVPIPVDTPAQPPQAGTNEPPAGAGFPIGAIIGITLGVVALFIAAGIVYMSRRERSPTV